MYYFSFCVCWLVANPYDQAQLRAETLQEENAAYDKAILNCENKIQEKLQEAEFLKMKLKVGWSSRTFFYILLQLSSLRVVVCYFFGTHA